MWHQNSATVHTPSQPGLTPEVSQLIVPKRFAVHIHTHLATVGKGKQLSTPAETSGVS